ncbi:MAG TPA: hypothetical protein VNW97_05400 [Candidatus Saccharimonadales bacterium]|jgi:hypothetical protein|nr:hypothetical protein [Candidatus Saccharimonadales bacterium]
MASWSEAFAAQARSDLDAYDFLTASTLPSSHRLHYLQMWLEKLCKAYLWMPESGADELRTKHNVVAKVLPRLVSEHWRRIGGERRDIASIRELCREIDLLHPQVDDNGRRPDNVEYPWAGNSGITEVPARWKFSLASRLHSNPGRLLLKAAVSLTRNPAEFIR